MTLAGHAGLRQSPPLKAGLAEAGPARMHVDHRASVWSNDAPQPMPTVLIYTDSGSRLDLQLPWALRIAARRGRELQILVRSDGKLDGEVLRIELGAEGAGAELAQLLDRWAGPWRSATDADDAQEIGEEQDEPELRVAAYFVSAGKALDDVSARLRKLKPDLLIGTQLRLEEEEAESSARRRRVLREVPCEVVLIRAGQEVPESDGLLVPCAQGPHAAAALRLARDLTPEGERFPALYIEPPIGAEASGVGRRILDRILKRALDDDQDRVERVVRIHDHRHVGIREECDVREPGLVIMGASKLSAVGQRLRGTVGLRVVKGNELATVAFLRAAIPIQSRAQRTLEAFLQRRVPQLEREARIDLFERVQSNSAWDFDFLVLMALATLIAAAGLILNSAAVIIGAMLVAPLMTPLLGTGLALVQGNPQLLRLTNRTVTIGFVVAVVVGALTGLLTPGFVRATPEMLERNWPSMLDLLIAFAAGLAGAYTSSRPSLLAALPGVAIAAALLPPIATAGLALSVQDYDLASGATLLFLVNAVAIVLATTFALWAVGLRDPKESKRGTRLAGAGFVAALSVLALYLSVGRPVYNSPDSVRPATLEAFALQLDDNLRMVRAGFEDDAEGRLLVLELGGPYRPRPDQLASLRAVAEERFGTPLRLRVISRWELEIE